MRLRCKLTGMTVAVWLALFWGVAAMGAEYPTKMCEGKNSMGTDIKCGVTMVPHDGKMLEILWYAGVGDYWDAGQQVFPIILSSIKIP